MFIANNAYTSYIPQSPAWESVFLTTILYYRIASEKKIAEISLFTDFPHFVSGYGPLVEQMSHKDAKFGWNLHGGFGEYYQGSMYIFCYFVKCVTLFNLNPVTL